jgi:hypothetical protein
MCICVRKSQRECMYGAFTHTHAHTRTHTGVANDNKITPLHIACFIQRPDIAVLLIEHYATAQRREKGYVCVCMCVCMCVCVFC